MSRRVSSPLANCKVAFSGAALRRQTAGSACSKWCPSAQKHFRVRKNTGQARRGTFKPPLCRRDRVLWRDHKAIRPGGMCAPRHKRARRDAALPLRTISFALFRLKSALWYLHVTQRKRAVTHKHASLTLWGGVCLPPDGQNLA